MKTKITHALLVLISISIKTLAQSNADEIERLKKVVEQCTKEAEAARKEALRQRDFALAAQKEANERRYLALAKAVAIESLEVQDDQLSALLAKQAFNFNKSNAGYEFDREVYKGLISALLRFDSTQIKPIPFSNSVVEVISLGKTNSILAIEKNGKIVRWRNQDQKWQSEEIMPTRQNIQIISVSISKDESTIALNAKAGKKNIKVEIYDLNDLKNVKAIADLDSEINCIRLTPDGKGFYALTNTKKSIIFSDLVNINEIFTSSKIINMIDVSSDGKLLAGITILGKLYTWNIQQNYSRLEFQIDGNELTSLSFTPKGKDLVVGNSRGQVKIITNGIIRRVLEFHHAPVDQIIFNHGGSFCAVKDRNNKILIWNWNDLNKRPVEVNESTSIGSISFSPNDDQILSRLINNSIHSWPIYSSGFESRLCVFIKRNMTKEEWQQYVGEMWDIPYQATCTNLPRNDK